MVGMSKVPQCSGNARISDSDDQIDCEGLLDTKREASIQTICDRARDKEGRRKPHPLK